MAPFQEITKRFNPKEILKRKLKHHTFKLIVLVSIFFAAIAGICLVGLTIFSIILGVNSSCDNDDTTDTYSTGQVSGDWTKQGTTAYKNAKQIFDTLTKEKGFSGAGAAGAVANAKRESGFNPKAINTGGGVAGVFQWSGFVHSLNGNRITQGGFIKQGDTSTLTMENEMKLMLYELNHGYASAASAVGNETDPEKAALLWSEKYEGVALSDAQTKVNDIKADAKAAYKLFNGTSISADKSKLGGKSSDSGSTNTNEEDNSGCAIVSSGDWGWPFKSIKSTPTFESGQQFGHTPNAGRRNDFHDGYDFGTDKYNNQDILAIHDGEVVKVGQQGSTQNDLGYYVVVKSDDGYYEVYQEFAFDSADKDAISVKVGDKVKTGDKIGELSTKYNHVTHVHIGVTKKPFEQALRSSFSDDGTWIDWVKELVNK